MTDDARRAALKAYAEANPAPAGSIHPDDRGRVSAHEAGHATIAHALGVAVRRIRLQHADGLAGTFLDPNVSLTDELAITCGGAVGEYMLAYRNTWRMEAAFASVDPAGTRFDDEAIAWVLARRLDPLAGWGIVDAASDRALAILTAHWDQFIAVWDELQTQDALDEVQIREIVEAHAPTHDRSTPK